VCASGLKITSPSHLANRRWNMPMSEYASLSPYGLAVSYKDVYVHMDAKISFHVVVIFMCWFCVLYWLGDRFDRFVKKKFEELYFQSSKPDRVDRVFKIYRTTALDQKLVKKTFKLIDESMRRSREKTSN